MWGESRSGSTVQNKRLEDQSRINAGLDEVTVPSARVHVNTNYETEGRRSGLLSVVRKFASTEIHNKRRSIRYRRSPGATPK